MAGSRNTAEVNGNSAGVTSVEGPGSARSPIDLPFSGSSPEAENHPKALALVLPLFITWGFMAAFHELLAVHLKESFELSGWQFGFAKAAPALSFLLVAMPAARLLGRLGYQRTVMTGLVAISVGSFLFVAAAGAGSAWPFLLGAMLMGTGTAVLCVAANLYVLVLGGRKTAASRLALAQGFQSLGGGMAPKIAAILMLGTGPIALAGKVTMSRETLHYYRLAQGASVEMPYVLVGATALVMAAIIGTARLPSIACAAQQMNEHAPWRCHHAILCSIGIFLSAGAAAAIGNILPEYLAHTGHLNVAATRMPAWYWAGLVVGQFGGAALLRKTKTTVLIAACAGAAVAFVCASVVSAESVAMWSLVGMGLCQSIMLPSLFTLGVAELGPLSGSGAALMTMGMSGGVLIPVALSAVAGWVGPERALLCIAMCYAFVLWLAVRENRTRNSHSLRFGAFRQLLP